MSTFLNKLRTVVLGNVHDLLDKAIDMNSPSALRQYTRDLEDALDRMKSEAAVQAGQIRTLTREKGDIEHQIDSGIATIKGLQQSGKDELARNKAAEVVRLKDRLSRTVDSIASQQKTSEELDKSVALLDAKHTDMVSRVRELERMDLDTKAKEDAASALHSAGKVVSGLGDISIDDTESRMRARNDVAQEKFSRAVGSLQVEEDADTASKVDDLLSEISNPLRSSKI